MDMRRRRILCGGNINDRAETQVPIVTIFDDSIDFIGWYTHGSQKRLKVSKWDAYGQYLAYHEGRGGYERKTYQGKPWLKNVASKVKRRAAPLQPTIKNLQG